MPVRRTAGDVDSIFTLNPVAARVWELLDGERDEDGIADAIAGEFDVRRDVAAGDIAELLGQLVALGAVKEA